MENEEEVKEVNLLDLLVVVAENLRLMILGAVFFGLLALGIAFLLPQSFISQAILAVPAPAQVATIMGSPAVLDPVIESLRLSEGLPTQVARDALARQVKATVGKDGLLRIEVTANSPSGAQSIANAIIDTWLKSTAAGGRDREDLKKKLVFANTSLDAVSKFMDRLTAENAADLTRPAVRGEIGTSIVAIGELRSRYQDQVLSIPRALQGLSREVVKQAPPLPTERAAPRKSLIALLAALGGGFLILVGAFIRLAWKNAAKDPLTADKQARLLAAIRFGARSH